MTNVRPATRTTKKVISDAMKAVAEKRRCPGCQRGNAMVKLKTMNRCRYCGHTHVPPGSLT